MTGYQNVWVRDNMMVANSLPSTRGMWPRHRLHARVDEVLLETQRADFEEIIDDPVRVLKEDANSEAAHTVCGSNLSGACRKNGRTHRMTL